MPLRLSRKDILDLEQGTHEDMLRVVEKLKERLAAKKKRREKTERNSETMQTQASETLQCEVCTKPVGRKIVKSIVLRPLWTKAVYQPLIPERIICSYKSGKRAREPAWQRWATPIVWGNALSGLDKPKYHNLETQAAKEKDIPEEAHLSNGLRSTFTRAGIW